MLLKDKIAIVTGGSRGIGFSTVVKFLKEGATVILCGSKEESANKAVAKLKEINSEYKVAGIWPNLKSYEDVKKNFDEVISKYGRIDILVNNAGVSDDVSFTNYTEEHFMNVMDLNVKAVFNCSRAVVDQMIEQKAGVILNTSSMVSKHGMPTGIAYPTSKFAVNGFTLSLARELGSKGIRVNAVAPGVTNTDMMKAVPEQYIKPLVEAIPLKRLGEPEDIANAFVYLASDLGSYVTGQVLHVDGLARN